MADTNRVQLRYVEETTWGTTPSTAALQEMRITGESLVYNIANIASNEIRDDRMVTDLIQTGAQNGGSVSFELSYSSFDDFIEGALFSDWSTPLSISLDTISFNVAGTISTTTATGFSDVVVGQWIEVSGATISDLDGYYMVTANGATYTELTVTPVPATTAAAGKTTTIGGSYIRNGTTEHSYSIERKLSDLSPLVHFAFAGMMVNSMNLSVQADSILTGSFDFIGKSASVSSASMSSGSVTGATTTDVFNAVANVGEIRENLTAVSSCLVRGIDFTVNNNLRGKSAIGELGFCDIGVGQCDVAGTLSTYFANDDLYAKYVAATETSLSFKVQDGDGNCYIFTFPRVAFESDGGGQTPGANQDIMENIGWRAIRDETYEYQIQIDKFAA